MPRLDFYSDYRLFLTVNLEEKDVLLGRGDHCDVQLPDDRVSREHALIRSTDEGYTLEDRSRNGTRVNFNMVNEATMLNPGDRIYVGDYSIIFQDDDTAISETNNDTTLF
jgi:pSer/pThr/pTyr-binding forkhead associated (FHA) protein